MRSAILLAAVSAIVVEAQAPPAPANPLGTLPKMPGGFDPKTCSNEKPVDPSKINPLNQFDGTNVKWPCDFGKPVPYGKVPAGCAKYEVIVARGTSEPGEFGTIVGDPLIARVIRDIGKDARGYPVQYPADASAFTPKAGEDASAALARRDVGPKDVVQRIASQMKDCPNERFALVGYSQGGGVISRAAELLSADQLSKIDAVVTYGAKGTFPKALQAKRLNNCAPGDLCGGLPGDEGHLSYNNKGTVWHDRSAKYLADAFAGKSQGQVFAKTSKQ